MTTKRCVAWFCLAIFLSNPACKAPRKKEPGIRLVIQVDIEDALWQLSRLQSLQMKRILDKKSLSYGKISFPDCRTILFTGDFSAQSSAMSAVFSDYLRDWESHFTTSEFRLNLNPQSETELIDQLGQQTMEAMRSRLKAMGVPRCGLLRTGSDRLLLEMGKLTNPERVMSMLRKGGLMEFRLVATGPVASQADALSLYPGGVPEDLNLLPTDRNRMERGYYLLQAEPVLLGRDISEAFRSKDEHGAPVIILTFKEEASRRLQQITSSHIGKQMAIVLDQRIVSAPVIQDAISEDCIIRGQFTVDEVDDMVLLLQSALPTSIRFLEQRTINPLLGNYDFPNGGFMFIVGFETETTSEKLDKMLQQANLKAEEIQNLGGKNQFVIIFKNNAVKEMDKGEQLATSIKKALSAAGALALLPGGSIPDWSSEKIWPSKK